MEQENALVFINPKKIEDEPFTTSAVIAQCANVEHHTITRLLRDYQTDFEEFGVCGFEIHKPPKGSKGGRPEKVYHLNEQQATLLMTYLRNTPQVIAFKKELVRQFFLMRDKLENLASSRNDFPHLTANIALIHDEPKFYHYSNECDMINRLVTGMSAKQFRESNGIRKGESIRPYLTPEQARMLDELQRADCYLLVKVQDFRQRKDALTEYRDSLTAYRDRRAALTSPTGGNRAACAK